jgi:hypothetical protein
MKLSRKKKIVFALLTMVLVLMGGLVLTLAADLVLHQRAERSAGLNRWGYRGPVIGSKQPDEVRIAMLGGSTVFGYGVMWNESIPALIEQRLRQTHPEQKWTAVNLGYNTEGAYSFVPNLRDFAYLDYDIVILYEGYNDLSGDAGPNYVTVRQQSPVFRSTGYFPILPLWLREKSMMLSAGDVNKAYEANLDPSKKTVFRPSFAARASASALDAAAAMTSALEWHFNVIGSSDPETAGTRQATAGCPAPWSDYCESQRRAIQYALDHGKKVLVAAQPQPTADLAKERHQGQQQALAEMVSRLFGSSPHVSYFPVGTRVNLSDPNICFDGMHLNVDGNRIVADALIDPLVALWSKR